MGLLGDKGYRVELTDLMDKGWVQFVRENREATVFHHPSWSEVLSKCYGYRPFVFLLKSPGNNIVGGLPVMRVTSWLTGKRCVSLPFSDHCKPLLHSEEDCGLFARALLAAGREIENMPLEIRWELEPDGGIIVKSRHYIHWLRLEPNPENLYKNFRKKGVQYCIKKAHKSGILVESKTNLEFLMAFYNLHLMTRKKLGVPTQPKRYFLQLWENVINKGLGFVMLAYHERNIIAGGVFLHFNRKVVYKYGATDPRFLSYYGNHMLLWKAIKWSCANEFELFDWGKTEINNDGLRKFKLGWGSDEEQLTYSYIGDFRDREPEGWKEKAVTTAIRSSPVWVGRAIGGVLYKHFG